MRFGPPSRVWALLLLTASTANAWPILGTATGTIDFVDGNLSSAFAVGDSFTFTYLFESSTPPRVGSNSNFAFFDALDSTSFASIGYSASSTGAPEIQIDNNVGAPPNDRYATGAGFLGSTIFGPAIGAYDLDYYFMRLDDSTATVFSDALILPTSLDLNSFDSRALLMGFSDSGGNAAAVTGVIDSLVLTPVPEPSLLALLSAPMGLVAWRWRKRRGVR